MARTSFSWNAKLLTAAAVCLAVVLGIFFFTPRNPWTPQERDIILLSDSVMYVTTLPKDSVVLRTPCIPVSPKAYKSKELKTLCAKMLKTVTDPSQDGVGIAASQVGIGRRVICVQRLDKEGEPFECYVNIRIDSLYGSVERLPEGCLSIPPKRGIVPRYTGISISYVDPDSGKTRQEKVEGYTARIFQHECDHLDGILYIDRADTVFIDTAWAQRLAQ